MTDARAGRVTVRWREALAVVLLAVAAHAPALHGTSFTLDDHAIVEHDPRLVLHGPGDLVPLVTTRYWGEAYQQERLWRPVVLVSFALDRTLFGPDPDAFRAVNVALHAATSALALALLLRVLRSRAAALTGALLFAAHPVHAEATAGVVGRAEVLGLLFALLGTLLHLRAREAPRAGALNALARWAAPALCFLLGFGAKEVALTAPFVLAVVERVDPPRPARSWLRLAAPYALYALAIVVYGVARWLVLGALAPQEGAQSIGALPLTTRALVAALVARDGVRAVLAPAPTAALYPFSPPTWTDPVAVLAVVVDVTLLVAAVVGLRSRRRTSRAFGLGVLGYFMTLGPSSNLIPIGVVFAERLLYTPSLWAILAVVAAAAPLLRRDRRVWAVALTAVLATFTLRLGASARAWTDDLHLWRSTLQRFDLPRAHGAYARELASRGDAQGALPHALQAVEAEGHAPTRQAAAARALLGQLLHQLGRTREALTTLEEARALRPDHEEVLATLLKVQLDLLAATPAERRGPLLAAAERGSREATRAVPHSYRLWLYRGIVLAYMDGREPDAEAAYDRAIERRAEPWEALFNRGCLRYACGDREGALADFRRTSATLLAVDRGAEARQVLPLSRYWEVRIPQELGRPAEGQAAREWLAAHRPELLRRLPG